MVGLADGSSLIGISTRLCIMQIKQKRNLEAALTFRYKQTCYFFQNTFKMSNLAGHRRGLLGSFKRSQITESQFDFCGENS